MKKRKPCGYYWRVVRKIKAMFHDNGVIYLEDYPKKAQVIIVNASFRYFPLVDLYMARPKQKKS